MSYVDPLVLVMMSLPITSLLTSLSNISDITALKEVPSPAGGPTGTTTEDNLLNNAIERSI